MLLIKQLEHVIKLGGPKHKEYIDGVYRLSINNGSYPSRQ